MEYLVLFTLSVFIAVIVSICFIKEVKMTHFVLFILSGITVIISTFCFLIFKFGFLGAILEIGIGICNFVVGMLMLYLLCVLGELINFIYKKIKNFVKKLLTK